MDFLSAVLLGALNIPILVSSCRWFQRTLHNEKENFWGSLLSWSFDPYAFFDKEHKHNHAAVLFISLTAACCALLIPLEYEAATILIDAVRGADSLQAFSSF